jgi:hypothetical protein
LPGKASLARVVVLHEIVSGARPVFFFEPGLFPSHGQQDLPAGYRDEKGKNEKNGKNGISFEVFIIFLREKSVLCPPHVRYFE